MTASLSLAVIGCGVIGSRHAQSLGLLDRAATIYLVDPSDDAQAQAARLFREGLQPGVTKELIELREVAALPPRLDVVIVATSAAERLAVIAGLLQGRRIAHLILEKFLFQREADYSANAGLLASAGVRAWVNCPRRLWPGYRALRPMLGPYEGPVMLACAADARFGVGTSAIHMLDALAFLSGSADFELNGEWLNSRLLTGKRGGVEMTGQLFGASSRGDFFRFVAHAARTSPSVTIVETASCRAVIDEGGKTMRVSSAEDDWLWRELPFEVLLQSQMTHRVVAELIDTGVCNLPGITESSRLHLAILRPLLAHYRRTAEPGAGACPIT